MQNIEEEIKKLIDSFDGKVCIYISDEKGNIIKHNENEVVETASCIKLFILIEYYNQILKNLKSRQDLIYYSAKDDHVDNGSGILQYLEDMSITSKNMAILMTIVSDNIATDKMIDYLGFDNINNTIKELGFENTYLISKKLDFNIYHSVGRTTAYEYAKAYKMLLNKEILLPELCDEIIDILKNQNYRTMISRFLTPKDMEEMKVEDGFINYIATKSGALGDEGKDDMINCRNDGGIFSTKAGSYIISIFISDFKDRGFYIDNPATILGGKISRIVFEHFKENEIIK